MNVAITSLKRFTQIVLFFLTFTSLASLANDKSDIDRILNSSEEPFGVVFELIGYQDGQYLPNSLKKIENYKAQLKKKFPDIEIAVVAHGSEQFELTKDNDKKQKKSHDLVKRITLDDTPVHICEAHANWRGVKAEEFPDYINVSASGPSQIRQYQELDYILVVIH